MFDYEKIAKVMSYSLPCDGDFQRAFIAARNKDAQNMIAYYAKCFEVSKRRAIAQLHLIEKTGTMRQCKTVEEILLEKYTKG